jgi:NTP pyrophosphatase (non-canonical NTP hydrolase)
MTENLTELEARILTFMRDRDWEQFHTPKNLLLALAGELGELAEHFQWLTDAEALELSDSKRSAVADEIADIQIYLLLLSSRLEINIADAVEQKMSTNAEKYPADKVRGSARKYNEY